MPANAQQWISAIAAVAAAVGSICSVLLHLNLSAKIDANHEDVKQRLAEIPKTP